MNFFKSLVALLFAVFIITACQKEMSLEQQFSEGTLKEDGSGNCLPFTISGVFKEDSLVNASNFIEVQINVTETGSYIIKSDTINGYSFSGAGTIDVPGLSTIRLAASGKPTDPGINSFTITYNTSASTSSCVVDVPVVTVGPPATYTLSATGSSCTGSVVSGSYLVGIPVGPGNTASVSVNVTVAGSYSLSTTAVNGVSFSASSEFLATGPQTVILSATGTPTAAGVVNFVVSGASNTCIFSVTIAAAPGAAIFTLGGAGSSCTGFTSAGTYAVGTPMAASNTVSLNVSVTTIGSYSISTTANNGVTFSATGIFATTGPQLVTLTGTGTPVAAGAITHIVNAGANSCTFVITYTTGTGPTDFIICKIDGVDKTFNDQAIATFITPNADLYIEGFASATSLEGIALEVDRSIQPGGTITTTAYTMSGTSANTYDLYATYSDPAGAFWDASDGSVVAMDPFTITISTLTTTRVTGTFSGTVRNNGGTGSSTKVITNGSFSLTIQ